MGKLLRVVIVWSLAAALPACSTGTYAVGLIPYRAIERGSSPAIVTVALQVTDARTQKEEGAGRSALGSFPFEFRKRIIQAGNPNVATLLIHDATVDALRLAGVAIAGDAPRRLEVVLHELWLDGYGNGAVNVRAELVLRDTDGRELWRRLADGSAGGFVIVEFKSMMHAVYQRALNSYAENAAILFSAPAFQRHIY